MHGLTGIHPKTLTYEKMRRFIHDLEQTDGDIRATPESDSRLAVPTHKRQWIQATYDCGGDEGLRTAISPDILPQRLARRTTTTVRNTLSAAHAGLKALRITDEGTAIGAYEISYNAIGEAFLLPICQLRLATATRQWHLYSFNRSDGEWWPYAPPESGRYRYTLKTRLQQVIDDRQRRFWLAG